MKIKLTALITVLAMLLSLCPGFSGIAAMPQKEYVVADFGGGSVPESAKISDQNEANCTTMAITDESTYNGKESSLAWTIGDTTGLLRVPYDKEWENNFDTINIRIRTETPGQKMNILMNELNTFSASKDKNYCTKWQQKPTTGDWQTLTVSINDFKAICEAAPEYIYIRFNCNGWDICSGTKEQFENGEKTGSKNYLVTAIKGEKLYIDSIWLENSAYGAKTLASPEPSIANGSIGAEPDLEGDKTYSLSFAENIYEIENAVTVTETVDETETELVRDVDYTASFDGNKINIVFAESLTLPSTIKVTLDSGNIVSESAKMLSTDGVFTFTVGNVVDFAVVSSAPADGSENVNATEPGFESTVEFNSTLPESGIDSFVEVLKNGNKYTDYTLTAGESKLTITFDEPLEGDCAYTVNISEGVSDIYNNITEEPFSYTFTTMPDPLFTGSGSAVDDSDPESIRILYTSNSDEHMEKAIKNSGSVAAEVTDVPGFYPSTLKFNWEKGQKTVSAWIRKNDSFTYEGMNYINYLIYQSVPSSMPFNLPLYYTDSTGASKNVHRSADANWSGWKLITLSMPTTAQSYDGVVVNVNGWSYYRDVDGFFCVSDIWLSKEMPTDISLVSSTVENGSENIATYGAEFEFKYSQNINTKIKPDVEFVSGAGDVVTDCDVTVDGKTVKVTVGDLEPATNYTAVVSNVYSVHTIESEDVCVNFTTMKEALSSGARKEFESAMNGIDAGALGEVIKENSEYFGVDKASDELIADIAEIVIANDDYADAKSGENAVRSVVSTFNSFNDNAELWSDVTALINSTPEFFGGESDSDYKYYTGLKEGKQNEISIALCENLPAESITDLNKKFENAIDDYKDSLKDNDKKGSSGGSGGGGSGKTTAFSTVDATLIPQNTVTPLESEEVFNDLAGFEWAEDSIIALNEAGIISSSAEKKFRPGDSITREEFVKLLVCAFAPDASNASHQFTDEVSGAWYSEYLTKAFNSGISKGYPDGSFGVGSLITREDMVTMAARAVELGGTKIGSDVSAGFADEASISDYALSYVNALSGAGVVNGMGNGNFEPKSNATRAQAAKIINQLISLYR